MYACVYKYVCVHVLLRRETRALYIAGGHCAVKPYPFDCMNFLASVGSYDPCVSVADLLSVVTSRHIDIITGGRLFVLLRLHSSLLYERIVIYLSVHLSVMPEFFLIYLLEIICNIYL